MTDLLARADLRRLLADLPGVVDTPDRALALSLHAPSFPAAVQLVSLVAEQAEELDHHPDLDLRWRTLHLRSSTHSAGGVTGLDVELVRRVLALAGQVGAEVRDAPESFMIAIDCVDTEAVRRFWATGLGYVSFPDAAAGDTDLRDPNGRGPLIWFQPMDPPRTDRNRIHFDVVLPDVEAAERRVAECLAAGGRVVTDAHAPSYWVLADPEGNELCVCTASQDQAPAQN
ncbi:MAG: pterin-4-alpha-carbinolamine dehydratase [Actinomycetales bacterium]|nr:pterin-4-alpha-carbinolamine dehydratase [Actinomycetales bacterium]